MVRVSDMIKLLQDDRKNWEEEIARNISVDDCRAMPAAGADRMQDDIKAYLTTFEQIMTIHKIDWSRCHTSYLLSLQKRPNLLMQPWILPSSGSTNK